MRVLVAYGSSHGATEETAPELREAAVDPVPPTRLLIGGSGHFAGRVGVPQPRDLGPDPEPLHRRLGPHAAAPLGSPLRVGSAPAMAGFTTPAA